MITAYLFFFLVIQQCTCSLFAFNRHRRTDYLQYHYLPEDELIEHLHPNTHGNTYVLDASQFTLQRPLWRHGAASIKPRSVPVDKVAEMILEEDKYERVPLRSLIQALWKELATFQSDDAAIRDLIDSNQRIMKCIDLSAPASFMRPNPALTPSRWNWLSISEEGRERINRITEYAKRTLYYGWIPFILILGTVLPILRL
ncbi:hypothetical protein PSACC_02746 [Paramicrosporidium saccamoebae]|uniref:Uncharacterized protein n=1 Tax=Paramicrosporidium saccamoebae TaxID=1246581 RepID=A0A2H9TI67_9FUNG|nr:hypothetical protein PSACC_02746 [Paramicrosporidium saccamoebae]